MFVWLIKDSYNRQILHICLEKKPSHSDLPQAHLLPPVITMKSSRGTETSWHECMKLLLVSFFSHLFIRKKVYKLFVLEYKRDYRLNIK